MSFVTQKLQLTQHTKIHDRLGHLVELLSAAKKTRDQHTEISKAVCSVEDALGDERAEELREAAFQSP